MCCEEWINASTSSLSVENCKSNCCDGTQTWFPLYNVLGDNAYYNSTTAYLTREMVPLVNDVCLTNIVGYTNEKPCYSTIVAALTQASVQNCVGYSTTQIGGTTCYTACNG